MHYFWHYPLLRNLSKWMPASATNFNATTWIKSILMSTNGGNTNGGNIDQFNLFGALILITGIKMFIFAEQKPVLAKNPVLLWMRNHLRITEGLERKGVAH